jgi:hypothetical protein
MCHVGFNFVREIVIDRVPHVVGPEIIFEAFLVNHFVFENFDHHVKLPVVFVGVEADLKHSIDFSLVVGSGVLLVGQNKIEDLLNQTET